MTYVLVPLPTKGKVPALNETANKYYKEVDFVVVFWCNKSEVKKLLKTTTGIFISFTEMS